MSLGVVAANAGKAVKGAKWYETALMGKWGLFGLGGMAVGTFYQAGAGSVQYRQLQETLKEVEKDYDDWVKKYEQLYQEYATLQIEMEGLVLELASQTARLRDDTQDIIIELNQKAIVINWLWFGIILLIVFIMIFKRFKVGRFFMQILDYPFTLLITAIVNGFLYIFGLDLYEWPKNPFVESDNNSKNYMFKMGNYKPIDKTYVFLTIIIVIALIIGITYLLLYCKFHKEQKYYRNLYDDPNYSMFIKYSKENQQKQKEKRNEKKKTNFKFNKRYDNIYRWQSFQKDLNEDLENSVCCNEKPDSYGNKPADCKDTQCVYTTKGFIGKRQEPSKDNKDSIWRPLKGISVNGNNQDKNYEGAPLFET